MNDADVPVRLGAAGSGPRFLGGYDPWLGITGGGISRFVLKASLRAFGSGVTDLSESLLPGCTCDVCAFLRNTAAGGGSRQLVVVAEWYGWTDGRAFTGGSE